MIAVIDYGVGNLFSLCSSLKRIGAEAVVTAEPAVIRAADKIILPGVGAFADAAKKLRDSGLDILVKEQAEAGKEIMGICLGMQLLFETSSEVRPCAGLGLIRGRVDRIKTELKLPHIGWNQLTFQNDSPLFRGLEDGQHVYFVHGFCGYAKDEANVIARTEYGASVVAAVQNGNVFGCQFHPEKSGETGLQILKNFGELNR